MPRGRESRLHHAYGRPIALWQGPPRHGHITLKRHQAVEGSLKYGPVGVADEPRRVHEPVRLRQVAMDGDRQDMARCIAAVVGRGVSTTDSDAVPTPAYFFDGALSRPPPDGLPVVEGQPAGPLPPVEPPPPFAPPPFEPPPREPPPLLPFAIVASSVLSNPSLSVPVRH